MKLRNIVSSIAMALLAFPLVEALAQDVTINVLETYDAPGGAGTRTRPQKINDSNNVVGIYVDPAGVTRGFYRLRDGTFRDPIVDPNDDANLTEGRGNDNRDMIGGDYSTSDGVFHGFFLKGTQYRTFDLSSSFTIVLGLNNRGSVGSFVDDSTGIQSGFTNFGGNMSTIVVPGAVATLVYGVNNENAFCGYTTDDAAITHGFYVDRRGRLRAPIDPDGSNGTILFAINDKNWMVGRYADFSGTTHALLFLPPDQFITYDYPGSTFTSFNGINKRGYISGRYTDVSGIDHGFIARASGATDSGTTEVTIGNTSLPARPAKQAAPRSKSPLCESENIHIC